ncbi:uncharacterized protein BDZ99DRAFT_448347 [Mytilinidion resinicola]|uniref:U6 snRNA phosphodiesterase n=1 Tax=Mytilinidion resinicola TaxID=574789 RepID=A0A6A6YE14_9PEZI|nr:uncharacterized protein BDZ99DRAFT_448347 [Mytilinidion resinicola]KAF2806798.1 hypothetical protein BDZ99DRAFT_448347 [Mytilinidion resinicola]
MPLVNYSDSEDESNGTPADTQLQKRTGALKRTRDETEASSELPPLPSAFHDLYTTDTRRSTRDDSSLHGGRKRAIPHKEGNWITHVYLEWHPTLTESTTLSTLISLVQKAEHAQQPFNSDPQIHSSLLSPLGTPLPLHISLSRSLVLVARQREPLLATLNTNIRKAAVRPFDIEATTLKWVPNYERTRWFLVLGLARPEGDELNKLLDACNVTAVEFGQPELYSGSGSNEDSKDEIEKVEGRKHKKKRRRSRRSTSSTKVDVLQGRSEAFHISIAWTLEDPGTVYTELLQSPDVEAFLEKEVRAMQVRFEGVKVKIGNAVCVVPLARKVDDSHGMLGL